MPIAEPPPVLPAAALREGHRALLGTFRELLEEMESPAGATPRAARAAAAFLRHSLLPFARAEEAALGGFPAEAEGAALDHAFLAAEIEALAGEARLPDPDRRAVRRRLHRLEAVLELHLAREEERDARLPSAPPPPAGGLRAMEDAEARAFLRGRSWGILATAGEAGPYAVPVGYAFDEDAVLLATGPGRKLRNLLHAPAVCLTVAEVESGERWRSVVVTGDAAPVAGAVERALALRRVHRQRGAGAPSAADLLRAARAKVFRVAVRELSGRARGWGDGVS